MKSLLLKLNSLLMDLLAKIQWGWLRKAITGREFNLTVDDWHQIVKILDNRNAFILTYSKSHLSSYASKLAHFLLTGKKATYSHALLNVESLLESFKLVEAISKGVVISKFEDVFNCDGVCILVPKNYSQEEFEACIWDYRKEVGKPYDDLFKLHDAKARSCIEVVFSKVKMLTDWELKMPVLSYMIKEKKNLTPQLLRECPDMEVLLEIKR